MIMKERIFNEIIIAVALSILLVLVVNPWHLWMPNMLTYAVVGALLILAGLFAGIAFRGIPEDEREELHLFFASKIGYFTGVVVLIVGVSLRLFEGYVDPWLAGALAAMVIGKVVAQAWTKLYK